jgi:hypothetical protein
MQLILDQPPTASESMSGIVCTLILRAHVSDRLYSEFLGILTCMDDYFGSLVEYCEYAIELADIYLFSLSPIVLKNHI